MQAGDQGVELELCSQKLKLESKLFYLDLKSNSRGHYLKIAETHATRERCTVIVPSSGILDFQQHFEFYAQVLQEGLAGQLEDKHLTVQTSDHSKVFQFQVRENPKGRFLRVFENGSGPKARSAIIIPAGVPPGVCWSEMSQALGKVWQIHHDLQETQAGELLALQLQQQAQLQQAQQLAAQQGAAVGGMLHPGMLMSQQQAMLPAPTMHQMRQVPGQTQGFAIDPQGFAVPLVPLQQAQPVAAQQQLVDPAALQAAAAARLVPHQQRLRQERQQQRQQQQDPGPALRLSDTGGFVLYCGSKQFHFDSGVNPRDPFLRITQVSGGERNSMVVPWHAITHFQMAISNCAMVHQLQQQPELAAGLQQQVASQQLQAALHGGLQGGMPLQRPLPGPGQALGAPLSQGLAQQAQAALTQGMALAAQQQGMGMGALGQQQGGLQGMSQVYGQQQAVTGSLQQQGQQAGLQAVLADFRQQQLQQQQAQGAQQQPSTPGQQRGLEAQQQQQQQQQALAEQAGRAHQAMVDALSSQQLGAGNLQTQQQQQQELWQEEHQQQGFLQLHQGMRDAEAASLTSSLAPSPGMPSGLHHQQSLGSASGSLHPLQSGQLLSGDSSGLSQAASAGRGTAHSSDSLLALQLAAEAGQPHQPHQQQPPGYHNH